MKKEPVDFIIEYYESIKDDYPHLSFADIERICRNNFRVIKSEMKNGTLRTIRLRYFGTFVVFRGRALGMLRKTEKMQKQGKVTKEIYHFIHEIVGNYLKREHNESIPYQEVSET